MGIGADIAQPVEQLTRNEQVVGSSPTVGFPSPPRVSSRRRVRAARVALAAAWCVLATLFGSAPVLAQPLAKPAARRPAARPATTPPKPVALPAVAEPAVPLPAAAEPPARTSAADTDRTGLRLVVLDPGHGGPNEGAPARFDTGAFEKTYTLDIAERVAAQLRAAGVEVVLTRTQDRPLDLQARVQIANRLGADVFVSLHLNSTERPGPVGHESFILSLDATDEGAARLARFENQEGGIVAGLAGGTQQPGESGTGTSSAVDDVLADLAANRAHRDAAHLAAAVQARVTPRSPFPNRGVKQAPFGVLKGAAMPAIVFEGGFLNHKDEGPWLVSEAGRAALAEGVALGVLDFGLAVLAPRRRGTPGSPAGAGTP